MTKQETKAVAVREEKSTAVTTASPDFMKKYAGKGTEDIQMSDVEIPRIKLLQALSPEVTEMDNARAGLFFHSIAELPISDKIKIVPLYIFKSYILWRPRHDGGGILARSDDGVNWNVKGEFTVKPLKDSKRTVTWSTEEGTVKGSGLDQWGSYDPENENSQPAATQMYNIVCYLPDHPELSPAVVTLQRSSVRVAKKFMSKLKLVQAPSFGTYFTMSSIKDQNQQGQDFFNYKFEAAGFVPNEAEFDCYKNLYETFSKKGVKIHDIDDLQEESPADDTVVDDNNKKF